MDAEKKLPKAAEFTDVNIHRVIMMMIANKQSFNSDGSLTAIVSAENISPTKSKEFKGDIGKIIEDVRSALFYGQFDKFVKPKIMIFSDNFLGHSSAMKKALRDK